MTLADRVVAWARARLEERYPEATGRNDGEPSLRFMGGRAEPWCGHFVACAFRECGAPIPGDVLPTLTQGNPLASVSFTERVFAEHDWRVTEPRAGDVIFLRWRDGSDKGTGRHIGIVESVNGNHVTTIEGNHSNMVARVMRHEASRAIAGYGRRPDASEG